MKKQLNVDMIQSELRGGSAFFPGYKGDDSPSARAVQEAAETERSVPNAPVSPPEETKPQAPERANARTDQRQNGKRIITRNSFEIYEDQMDSLRKLSFREKMTGKLGSMSGMVREAIDTYLKSHPQEN